MLLRSSSSPVLESLLRPLVSCHSSEPSADLQAAETPLPKCLSLTTFTAHGVCPTSSFRKVLSENDLCSLASRPVWTSNSLLQDDSSEACPSSNLDLARSRSHARNRTLLPLSRRRSLSSLPSELLSVFFESDSAILEEGEVASPNSTASSEEEEERKTRVCVFDKLAFPVSEMSNLKVRRVKDTADVHNMVGDSSLYQGTDTADVGIEHNMVGDSSLYQGTVDETNMQDKHPEMDHSENSAEAISLGRYESSHVKGQGTSYSFGGCIGTAMLVPQVHDQASQPKHVYLGDPCEQALGAGAGGRGARPPTGGRGDGGEAGGHGGRNSDPTELHYQSMLKNNPGHPLILQNYAQYLAEVKRDYRRAEEFFQRAILANPSDGELLGQYAKMLWEVQQDRKRAATYFERAVQAAPDNSYVMAAYASFLWSAEEEEEEEEEQGRVEEVKGLSPANVPVSVFSLVSTGLI